MTTKIAINLSYEKPWFWFYSDEAKEGDPIVLVEYNGTSIPPRSWYGKIAGVSANLPGAVLAVFEETHFYSANAAVSPDQPDLDALPPVLIDGYLESIEVAVSVGGSRNSTDAILIVPKPNQMVAVVSENAHQKKPRKSAKKK